MERVELFPFFRELSARGRAELARIPELKAAAGQVLLSRGAPCGGAYLVVRGALRVFYFTDEGREATLYHVTAGQPCVLALVSTIHGRTYPAWVQAARSAAAFLRVPDPTFHRLIEQEPGFRNFVMRAMGERIFELMTALEQVATRTVVQRVAAYLLEHGTSGELVITQEGLAAELGTAREVVFRSLAALTELGCVARRRGRVQILDRGALTQLAGDAPAC